VRRLKTSVLLGALALLAGCRGGSAYRATAERETRGDAPRGKTAIERLGCGSCHTIPGIRSARALVGPSLERIASRAYIAGRLTNEPETMVSWIRSPEHFRSPTAMPDTRVKEQEARDIAAYLYTLW
jgi:cytochrome c2